MHWRLPGNKVRILMYNVRSRYGTMVQGAGNRYESRVQIKRYRCSERGTHKGYRYVARVQLDHKS